MAADELAARPEVAGRLGDDTRLRGGHVRHDAGVPPGTEPCEPLSRETRGGREHDEVGVLHASPRIALRIRLVHDPVGERVGAGVVVHFDADDHGWLPQRLERGGQRSADEADSDDRDALEVNGHSVFPSSATSGRTDSMSAAKPGMSSDCGPSHFACSGSGCTSTTVSYTHLTL